MRDNYRSKYLIDSSPTTVP